MPLKDLTEILQGTSLLPCESGWDPLKIEAISTSLVAETIGQEMDLDAETGERIEIGTETGIGEGIGEGIEIGIDTEVAAGPDPETEVMIEGLNIAVGTQDIDLDVYSVLYPFIYLVFLNPLYCHA